MNRVIRGHGRLAAPEPQEPPPTIKPPAGPPSIDAGAGTGSRRVRPRPSPNEKIRALINREATGE
jgi:hypothetical protein